MKQFKTQQTNGSVLSAILGGLIVLATGCVEHRVSYVQPPRLYPVQVVPAPPPVVTVVPAAPVPPPPAPVVLAPEPVPPPGPVVPFRSGPELDTLLAPIALYPDPLMAQILPGATLPAQVVLADRYVRKGRDVGQIELQDWDDSIKALARYPGILKMMDDNLAWTTDLGQAFLYQREDVMNAIQRLRARALAVGNLQSTPQQTVMIEGGIIEIVPASPQVIYVPVYQPEVIYLPPPPRSRGLLIAFGSGFSVGGWLNHDCDWHRRELIVWHRDHPRPVDWWYQKPSRRPHATVINNVTVVNNHTTINQTPANRNHREMQTPANFTVWRPSPPSANLKNDRADRGWGPREVPPTVTRPDALPPASSRNVPPAPGPEKDRPAPSAREARPAVTPSSAPPATAARQLAHTPPRPNIQAAPTPKAAPRLPTPKDASLAPAPRQVQAVPAPRAATPATMLRPSAPAAPVVIPRPAGEANARTSGGALTGIESVRVTRESSIRGQHSRETMAKPGAAPRVMPAPKAPAKPNAVDQNKR